MTSVEFAYWLQGFFEITETKVTELSVGQVNMINKHLELVFKCDKTPSIFCSWLKGFVEACDKPMKEDKLTIVRLKLHNEFQHVIDPSYSDDSDFLSNLNNTHGNTLYRC